MDIDQLLKYTFEVKASDLHMTVGQPPTVRIDGELVKIHEDILKPKDTEKLVEEILSKKQYEELIANGEIDLSISRHAIGRFRLSVYKQRGCFSFAFRTVSAKIPTMEELMLPEVFKTLANKQKGLILVTGATGSGKSTTLAAMVDYINKNRSCHIITLEDPIEFLHAHSKGIVNQREVGNDTTTYANGLRAALRQDPDVILVGEMRDLETISIAITAAETGHLVLSTLHTTGVVNCIDRIVDVFPSHQQQQIKVQLAGVLIGVVSQQLIPREDVKGRVLALEIMTINNAVKNLIRESKSHQLLSAVQTGTKDGMVTMEQSLSELVKKCIISKEVAKQYSVNTGVLETYLR